MRTVVLFCEGGGYQEGPANMLSIWTRLVTSDCSLEPMQTVMSPWQLYMCHICFDGCHLKASTMLPHYAAPHVYLQVKQPPHYTPSLKRLASSQKIWLLIQQMTFPAMISAEQTNIYINSSSSHYLHYSCGEYIFRVITASLRAYPSAKSISISYIYAPIISELY